MNARTVRRRSRSAAVAALGAVGLEGVARDHVLPRVRSFRSSSDMSRDLREWNVVKTEIHRATQGDGPVVVGPWLSEVGFEVLYWTPFLRWLADRFALDPSRLVAVSRGGTASWYDGICGSYHDVFEWLSPEEFKSHMAARWADTGGQKQIEFNKWDLQILNQAGGKLEYDRRAVLHPSLMYGLFRRFWRERAPIRRVLKHVRFERFRPPETSAWDERLPEESYVAVKFYSRPSFPPSEENQQLVRDVVESLARHSPVVALNTGLGLDDHVELDPGTEDRVTWLLDGVPPEQNLHVQTIAISRAAGFVGTYGGLSYLPPMYGKPSLALYSDSAHFLPAHLDLARRAAAATGGSIAVLDAHRLAAGRMPLSGLASAGVANRPGA